MSTWIPVAGWEDLYEVSDAGEVRRISTGRILRPSPNPKGYLIAVLSGHGRRWGVPVHRLVAEAFIGPLPQGMHTCHSDGDNQNNAAANLRYDTRSENELDKVRHGRNANSNKSHCPQGHAYTADNLVGGTNGRKCRTCHRERAQRRRLQLTA